MNSQSVGAVSASHEGTVLLALHYQNEVLHRDGKIRVGVAEGSVARQQLIDAARTLLEGARARNWPVVSVRIAYRADYADVIQNCRIFRDVVKIGAMPEGSWGAEFYEGLGPRPERPREFVVKHSRVNAFFGSQLEEILTAVAAKRLIVAGIATNSVVEHTVRHAADAGYEVVVASDACSSGDPSLHEGSLRNMSLIAEIMTVKQSLTGWP